MTMTRTVKPSFQDYLLMVIQYKRDNPTVRMGQAYVNVLYQVKPKTAEYLQTDHNWLDPFYEDDKIGSWIYEVCATWDMEDR